MYRCRMNNRNACGCSQMNNNSCGCQRNNESTCGCSSMIRQNNIQNDNMEDDDCQCGFNDPMIFPENYMYGQSYVPIQFINTTFKPDVGLKMGTIFPELVSPYEPCQSMRENAYLREVTADVGQCPNAR